MPGGHGGPGACLPHQLTLIGINALATDMCCVYFCIRPGHLLSKHHPGAHWVLDAGEREMDWRGWEKGDGRVRQERKLAG